MSPDSPFVLLAVGALLALVGGLWSRPEAARGPWRLGVALAVCAAALGGRMMQPDAGLAAPVVAHATQAEVPVRSTVVLGGGEGRRRVRALALSREVPAGRVALGAMFALGLVGLLGFREAGGAQRAALTRARLLAAVPAVGGLIGAGVWLSAGGVEQGEAAVRRFLTGVDGITGFTVPPGTWTYDLPGTGVMVAAAIAGALGVGSLWGAARPPLRRLLPLGAALAALGVGWQIIAVGGVPWRPGEASAWVAALLLSGAWLARDHDTRAAALVGAAVAFAGLSLG